MKKLLLLLPLLPFLACAQGVHFEDSLSWTAIRAKAKAENKYIFMDCYTTWCGPCRYMATQVFPQKESGDYFNDKFISVSVQLDTTKADNDIVRAWYADGHDIATKYGVRAYPTYLIFTPDGSPLHRMVGAQKTDKFITALAAAFDTTAQYYTLLDQYQHSRRDSAFLRRLALECDQVYDGKNTRLVATAYLATQTDLMNRNALMLADACTSKITDPYFDLFANHGTEIDKIMGDGVAEAKIRSIFVSDALNMSTGADQQPNWKKVHATIAGKLPAQADEMTARIKVNYYRAKKDWPDFEKVMVAYMKTYSDHMSIGDLNSIAWAVFQGCPDMTCVSDILDWSKGLKTGDPAFMDTYANILYKLGKKDEAIALETKAVSLTPDAEKGDLQSTLDKMKKGEKTWD
jgi:thioredoxin-related protein